MCSSLGFAPALRGFEVIPGGWYIVVMDFIDDEYHDLKDSPAKGSFETEVREKVTSLHQAGFVHGDIRSTNIMVKTNGSPGIMLVDFDWAGVIGEVRYPMNVNNVDIKRPDGAHDNELVMAQHDMLMIDFMFE
jgi:tRNA A-37 threonylcarbamoyl transferase component Bud32